MENGTERTRNIEEGEREPNYDAVIIFGYGPVGKPIEVAQSKGLPGSQRRTRMELLRTEAKIEAITANELYRKGRANKIIFTGGQSGGEELPSEAELMRDYLEKLGVPSKNIILEAESLNTIENMINVINLIGQNPDEYRKLAFLSCGFHKSRMTKIASEFGLQVSSEDIFSAEDILKEIKGSSDVRTRRYQELLEDSLGSEYHEQIMQEEKRWERALKHPAYLLPKSEKVGPEYYRILLRSEKFSKWLENEHGIDTDRLKELDDKELMDAINKLNPKRGIPPEE